mmetsp:Transcript_27055/g.59147  ORF Transcript_27055/g.59147 Transcript_27055/m.59147 type:complete len:138 (+) Transcript_27055:89-502(+)|eukprot:CAMPEP_0202920694 /NCGR_PEP_ID=MMETSP1392-20130828/76993_1 /ASSEMBLY_ACC=CAM_ASM_000868 /TAXON_ID=225041 /ORGANISM="Chlamydomonas chlamydogama, Strain SAG 11-48b" /LENGTH=137 /DNA_ID=CAMNT_0049614203 /DNA_START=89 /DNA_END=502 /DNA_ORIENTATION=-
MAEPPIPFDQLNWVKPEYVAEALKEKQDITVIDVREPDEFKEGHINGAINISSKVFADVEQLDKTALDAVKQAKGEVVMHCMLSLKRGPTAASHLVARLKELGLEHKVSVLEGGIASFAKQYNEDSGLITGTVAEQH